MPVEADEVAVEERDGAPVVCALELDKLGAVATVVLTVPTRTRTRVRDTSEPFHAFPLLLS
jgi:hypothetical protein